MNSKFLLLTALLNESSSDIKIGDTILVGRFKNVKAIVKGFGKDKKNQPTVKTNKGSYNLYRFRIQKLMPEKKD